MHIVNWSDRYYGRWFTHITHKMGMDELTWLENYMDIVCWIGDNIEGAYKHCMWRINDDSADFCFRHERDYLIFLLRWS